MKYIIFSLNSLCAYQSGSMRNLLPVYLADVRPEFASLGDKTADWTNDISKARTFFAEGNAWKFASIIWGEEFAYATFGVLCVNEKALEAAQHRKVVMTDDPHIVSRSVRIR